jgi:hypothetical protein
VKLKVVVRWVESVDTDRALFGVSDQEFEGILRSLGSNPLIGTPMDGDGSIRQFEGGNYLVRYAISSNFRNLVIFQLRPKSELVPQWKLRLRKFAGDMLVYLGREGLKKWLGL